MPTPQLRPYQTFGRDHAQQRQPLFTMHDAGEIDAELRQQHPAEETHGHRLRRHGAEVRIGHEEVAQLCLVEWRIAQLDPQFIKAGIVRSDRCRFLLGWGVLVAFRASRRYLAGEPLSATASVRQAGLMNSLFNISAVFPLLCGFSSNNV